MFFTLPNNFLAAAFQRPSATSVQPGNIGNLSRANVSLALSIASGIVAFIGLGVSPAHAQTIQRSMVNPSFEATDPGGTGAPTYDILPNTSVPGWDSSTGEVELWDSGFEGNPVYPGGVPAAQGNVLAEMNANEPGTLYQNVCLINGENFSWQFYHRNRFGGEASQNATFEIASSTGTVEQLIFASEATDPNVWLFRSGSSTFTGTTGVKRVQFVTTDAGSYGNFLDGIQIAIKPVMEFNTNSTSADEAAASPTLPRIVVTGNLTAPLIIQVNVTGGTATLGADYSTPSGTATFNVTIPAGNYTGSTFPLGITIIHDATTEVSETIQLGLVANPTVYTQSSTTSCGGSAIAAATHTITDTPLPILASPDTVTGIDGVTGNPSALNVFGNDQFNSAPATTPTITASVVTPASPIGGGPVPTFNTATGIVSVPPGTPGGSYSITYEICETAYPGNCSQTTATITVAPWADVRITKTNTPGVNAEVDQAADTVNSGSTTAYTLTVTNNGPSSVTGAVVTDTPGAGITCPAGNPVTITGSGVPSGSFTISNLTGAGITLGTLANGQSAALTFTCNVN